MQVCKTKVLIHSLCYTIYIYLKSKNDAIYSNNCTLLFVEYLHSLLIFQLFFKHLHSLLIFQLFLYIKENGTRYYRLYHILLKI